MTNFVVFMEPNVYILFFSRSFKTLMAVLNLLNLLKGSASGCQGMGQIKGHKEIHFGIFIKPTQTRLEKKKQHIRLK